MLSRDSLGIRTVNSQLKGLRFEPLTGTGTGLTKQIKCSKAQARNTKETPKVIQAQISTNVPHKKVSDQSPFLEALLVRQVDLKRKNCKQ